MRIPLAMAASVLLHAAFAQVAAAQPASQFTLLGSAALTPDGILLTGNGPFQLGAAYLRDRQTVRNGFDIQFEYTIGPPVITSAAGEGMSLILQNQGAGAVGSPGSGLGVNGLRNALAISIRTGPSQSIDVRAASGATGISFSAAPLASAPVTAAMLHDGPAVVGGEIAGNLRVRYFGGLLSVRLNGDALLSMPINLESFNGQSILDGTGSTYIGFAAATGQFRTNRHFLGDLTFSALPTPGAAGALLLGGLVAMRRRR